MKRLIPVIITIAILIAACGGSDGEQENITQVRECTQTIVYAVSDSANNLVQKYVSPELHSRWAWNYEEQNWQWEKVNVEDWDAFFDPINADIAEAEAMLGKIYVDNELIDGPYFYNADYGYYSGYDSFAETTCPDSDSPNVDLSKNNYDDIKWTELYVQYPRQNCEEVVDDYCTNITKTSTVTYVKVTTPGGSQVSYSYPTPWIDQIVWAAFANGPAFEFNPEFTDPKTTLDEEAYATALLDSLTTDAYREVAQVNLNFADFEGRQEIKGVIMRALEVAAVEEGKPAFMTIKGMMSSGQTSVAHISATRNDIRISGWMFLGMGGLSGSGGGGQLEMDYSSTFEDVVRGSIYIIAP